MAPMERVRLPQQPASWVSERFRTQCQAACGRETSGIGGTKAVAGSITCTGLGVVGWFETGAAAARAGLAVNSNALGIAGATAAGVKEVLP